MQDNQLFALLIRTLVAGEASANIPGVPIVQAWQPTQQGVNSQTTAYIYKVSDHRLGYPYRADIWDTIAEAMTHTEVQDYESTFQISVLSTQSPATPTQLTASDYLNAFAYILQSNSTIASLAAQGVGMLRISEIRNPAFTDDRMRFEFAPSLDFVVQHRQVITTTDPSVYDVTFNLLPI